MIWSLFLACRPEVDPPAADASGDVRSLMLDVDPFIGTGGQLAQVTGVSPGASAPLGMVLASPDSRALSGAPTFMHLGGYHYDDTHISGFAHTRGQGLGIHDFGAIQIMPRAAYDPSHTLATGRMSAFDHAEESASPGRYGLRFEEGVEVDIVATVHGAHHRYTFPDGVSPVVYLDLGHTQGDVDVAEAWARADGAEVEAYQRLLGGYSARFGGLQTHAVLRFDPPPEGVGGWTDPAAPTGGLAEVEGSASGLWLTFPAGTDTVDVRVALSYVDHDGARANLAAELPDLDLEARVDEVEAAWRGYLDRVEVSGGEARERRIFATALYHTLIMPSRQDDVDGRYRGLDGEVHTTDHPYYSDLSLWDTFRTLHPWYTLAWPELQVDVLKSLGRMVEDGGDLPRWPMAHGYTGGMIGSPATQVLAEGTLKGLEGWPVDLLFEAAVASASGPRTHASRDAIEDYLALGWVPTDRTSGAASKTLEYAWSDHALVRWGEALGRDVEVLRPQAAAWENTWDADAGFFRGRRADGSFEPFEGEFRWSTDFVEGNAWHYVWGAPQDVEGMIRVQHGGDRQAFLDRMADYWDEVAIEPDDGFPDDWYWHGNEPVLHYAALGSLAGDRALSVRAGTWVAEHRYDDTPEGLDGNDDAGTLSAWYLWNALGLYPVAGTERYAVLSPRFPDVRLVRDAGDVVIRGPGTPDEVTELWVDGDAVTSGEIVHEQLLGGLTFR